MKIKLLITICLIAFLSSCSIFKNKKQSNTSDLVNNKWKVIEIYNELVPQKINGINHYINLDLINQNYTAATGCNTLNGLLAVTKDKINFKSGISTLMACTDMKLENNLKKLFSETSSYKIDNGYLNLFNNKNNVIAKLQLFSSANNLAELELKGEWELDYIANVKSDMTKLFPSKRPSISFDSKEKTFSGSGSCNMYSGLYTIESNHIKFGAIAATKMACPSMSGESQFFNTLNKVNSFSVHDNTLTFIAGDIAIMRFKRIK